MAGKFLNDMRKESRLIAPTAETLNAVAARLKGRLIRKKGVSPEKELARRQRARGIFARKWKIDRKEMDRNHVRIWLIDTSASSEKVDKLKGVSAKAEKTTGKEFKAKLDGMANKLARNF